MIDGTGGFRVSTVEATVGEAGLLLTLFKEQQLRRSRVPNHFCIPLILLAENLDEVSN